MIAVIGAGFTGVTIANVLANSGFLVDVFDSRDHVAGNAYDVVEDGIRIHKYGPHLFHTNNERVWNYISQFGEWIEYKHKVKAVLRDGTFVTLPVNRETTRIVGKENILDTFYRPYTKKMWGVELEQLDPSIINRVPIRDDDNDLYFPDDKYQFLPKDGYTDVVNRMLDHPNIKVRLGVSVSPEEQLSMSKKYQHIFTCSPIDEFFDYKHGRLPYRSIKFHHKTFNNLNVSILPTATVNFTNSGPYTRVTEWKILPNSPNNGSQHTVLTLEEPCDYMDNNGERYYPVKDISGVNRETYNKYKEEADLLERITFCGRLAQYVYIDMHQAINIGLTLSKRFIDENSATSN